MMLVHPHQKWTPLKITFTAYYAYLKCVQLVIILVAYDFWNHHTHFTHFSYKQCAAFRGSTED